MLPKVTRSAARFVLGEISREHAEGKALTLVVSEGLAGMCKDNPELGKLAVRMEKQGSTAGLAAVVVYRCIEEAAVRRGVKELERLVRARDDDAPQAAKKPMARAESGIAAEAVIA